MIFFMHASFPQNLYLKIKKVELDINNIEQINSIQTGNETGKSLEIGHKSQYWMILDLAIL